MAEAGPIICPKCGAARPERTSAPEWQCPACGIAYAKYAGYLEKRRAFIQQRPADTDVTAAWATDGSLWSLIAANAFTLIVALFSEWTLTSVLIVYWGQSVVIGLASAARILALDRFSTKGFKINGRQADATAATKRSTAVFFLLHYGAFHFLYLIFLLVQAAEQRIDAGFGSLYAIVIGAFAVNHFFSLRYNVLIDRSGYPNLGTLMATPYLRILPMHLIIIFGAMLEYSKAALVLFIVLKTLADVAMHLVEHRYLSRATNKSPD